MATTGFSASNYHSVADHADFTHPNGDWSELLILNASEITGTYVPLSNGPGWGSNTRQIYLFGNTLELVVNGNDGSAANISSNTWYLVCIKRSGTSASIRHVEMGTTTVTAGSTFTLSAASNPTGSNYVGRANDGTADPFNGAISDWLVIPGTAITDSDLQDIATGTAIDSFSWYSSDAVFWGILDNQTNTDYIGSKTITENGTLSTTSDPPDLVRFGTTIINGVIGTTALAGVTGQRILGATVNGNIGTIAATGVTGGVLQARNGNPGIIASVGITGQVIDPDSAINGVPGVTALVGVTGQTILDVTINGSVGALAASGVSGDTFVTLFINGNIGTIAAAGVTGSAILDFEYNIDGNIGTIAVSGVTGLVRRTVSLPVHVTNSGANLFIITRNVFDDATLSATSTAATFDVDNMKLDDKFQVWRSTDLTTQTIEADWGDGNSQTLSAVGVAFSNLSASASIRAKLYTDTLDVSPVLDTGWVTIDYAQIPPKGFSTIGLVSFGYGGGTYASLLFDNTAAEKLEILFDDGSNGDGYIEVSRIVAGLGFTPTLGATHGVDITRDDNTTAFRMDAGNSVVNRGTTPKVLNFALDRLEADDRKTMLEIINYVGESEPVFMSLYENSSSAAEKQSLTIYGRFTQTPNARLYDFNATSSQVQAVEI